MLTLNEIRNVNFRKANFGGYRAEDVEAFIDEVQLSYDALLRENAELVKKLEVLAARLAEYQQEEDSIRNALMNAQKVGDASLRDAKHKAEIILKDATIKAERIVSNAQAEIHREREIIERMQRDIADFKARLLRAYKDHLTLINNLPTGDILTPETREMSDSVMMLDRRAAAPFSAPTETVDSPEPQVQPRSNIPPVSAQPAAPAQRAPIQPRPAAEASPLQPSESAPSPSMNFETAAAPQSAPAQRKGGFTVSINGDDGQQPAPRRAPAREPRFAPSYDEVSMPADTTRLSGARINEDSIPADDDGDSSPASLFRRRKQ